MKQSIFLNRNKKYTNKGTAPTALAWWGTVPFKLVHHGRIIESVFLLQPPQMEYTRFPGAADEPPRADALRGLT